MPSLRRVSLDAAAALPLSAISNRERLIKSAAPMTPSLPNLPVWSQTPIRAVAPQPMDEAVAEQRMLQMPHVCKHGHYNLVDKHGKTPYDVHISLFEPADAPQWRGYISSTVFHGTVAKIKVLLNEEGDVKICRTLRLHEQKRRNYRLATSAQRRPHTATTAQEYWTERDMLRLVDNPLISPCASFVDQKQRIYDIIEFFDGGDLCEGIARLRTKLALPALTHIAHSTLDTLVLLEQAQCRHSDVKPENILVRRRDAKVVLGDLGAAHAVAAPFDRPRGTFRFFAPELLVNQSKPAPGRDVFALGQTLLDLILFPLTNDDLDFSFNGLPMDYERTDYVMHLPQVGKERQRAYESWRAVYGEPTGSKPSSRYIDAIEAIETQRRRVREATGCAAFADWLFLQLLDCRPDAVRISAQKAQIQLERIEPRRRQPKPEVLEAFKSMPSELGDVLDGVKQDLQDYAAKHPLKQVAQTVNASGD